MRRFVLVSMLLLLLAGGALQAATAPDKTFVYEGSVVQGASYDSEACGCVFFWVWNWEIKDCTEGGVLSMYSPRGGGILRGIVEVRFFDEPSADDAFASAPRGAEKLQAYAAGRKGAQVTRPAWLVNVVGFPQGTEERRVMAIEFEAPNLLSSDFLERHRVYLASAKGRYALVDCYTDVESFSRHERSFRMIIGSFRLDAGKPSAGRPAARRPPARRAPEEKDRYASLIRSGRKAFDAKRYEAAGKYFQKAGRIRKTGEVYYWYLRTLYEIGEYKTVAKKAGALLKGDEDLGKYRKKLAELRKRAAQKAKKK